MDKKNTGIVAYLTIIGLMIALLAGDREGAKFHVNQALVIWVFSFFTVIPYIGWAWGVFMSICWVTGLLAAVNGEEKEVPLIGAYRVRVCTTSARYVRILDFRESNEESSTEATGCKVSASAESDDCTRVGQFGKLLDFRHFERHMMFSQGDSKKKPNQRFAYKKVISDGVNVSVVLDMGCGNTSN